MPALEIHAFDESALDEAALLLAARHREQRRHEPLLPADYEEPGRARPVVEAAWREPHAAGVVARRGGRLVGYLIGAPQINETWGRSAWVRLGGHALAPGEDADLYRDLYAALAPRWLEWGCFAHYALISASDRAALDAWFALSFGQQQALALRELPSPDMEAPAVDGITIRKAGPDDLETLLTVSNIVSDHQTRSPVYAPLPPETLTDRRADYAELLADPDVTLWLAERGGGIEGFAIFTRDELSDKAMHIPSHCCELLLAAIRPDSRSRGIGRALTARGLSAAHAQGYRACATDWRTTNLLASRFWPRQGFRPVAYRLTRQLDPRIAWARQGN